MSGGNSFRTKRGIVTETNPPGPLGGGNFSASAHAGGGIESGVTPVREFPRNASGGRSPRRRKP